MAEAQTKLDAGPRPPPRDADEDDDVFSLATRTSSRRTKSMPNDATRTPGALVSEVKAGKPTTEDFPEPVYGGSPEPAGSSETRRQLKRNRTGGSVVSESDVAIAEE